MGIFKMPNGTCPTDSHMQKNRTPMSRLCMTRCRTQLAVQHYETLLIKHKLAAESTLHAQCGPAQQSHATANDDVRHTVAGKTWRERILAPRRTMVQASPISTPEKWMSLSSPIMISSMSLQLPNFSLSGLSNVDAISPPKARQNLLYCTVRLTACPELDSRA